MAQYLSFAVIGLAFGCLYAGIGMGVVVTYRGAGVINFGTGAIAMWGAYVYAELREKGDLVLPVAIIPHRISIADKVGFVPAFLLGVLVCAVLGLLSHVLVFRPLRAAPVLAKVVASVGILLFLQALAALQFGSASRIINPIFGRKTIDLGGTEFPRDRIWLAVCAIGVAMVLAAYFRWARYGLATSAAAENERATALAGYSPQLLAASTWILASVVAGGLGILVSPATPLNSGTYSLAIIPALAAALIGRLRSIGITAAAGLCLGAFQSVVTFQTGKPWWPKWAITGLSDAVPFVLIIVGLFVWGNRLPTRGELQAPRLPAVPRQVPRARVVVLVTAVGAVAILATSGGYRFGVITSMVMTVIMLSFVVLTGFVGQISLAQAAIAGVGGFALSKFTVELGVPFPLSLLMSSLVAAAFGVVIGIPALRVRGANLAVVTLAAAVALERFVFRNSEFTQSGGNPIRKPVFFGLNLAIQSGRTVARWQFGLAVLVVLVPAALAVGNLARSASGRRFLAIRSNERAAAAAGVDVAANKLVAFAMSSFLAGLGGSLIGYSRGQLSADSFTAAVGLGFLAFAYLGGITSVKGAIVAGTLAPLGVGFVVLDRWLNLGNSYGVLAGLSLIVTALINQEGIAGATRKKRRPKTPVTEAVDISTSEAAPVAVTVASPAVSCGPAPRSETSEVALRAHGIGVRYGGVIANENISLEVRAGQIVGLIGPNGAGKTTFIDAVSGFTPFTGSLHLAGQDIAGWSPHARARIGLSRTWQSIELFSDLTVAENLRVTNDRLTARSVMWDIIAPSRGNVIDVTWPLDLLGLSDHAGTDPTTLPYGKQKLVGVSRALANNPRVLMLDEPAAGLDTHESEVLGHRLAAIAERGIAVLLVDHDMGLVLDVCDYVYVVDFGRVIAHGRPAEIRVNPVVVDAYLGSGGNVTA
jgi:ABC-type branched-subunit amino acid transport system ATPase component/branched-subunit amino acid ABC-type transport system permease component